MTLHGMEPAEPPVTLGEAVDDGRPTEAWKRALQLSAQRRRN